MSGKSRLRGQAELGAAIDERLRRQAADTRLADGTGTPPAAPLNSGGTVGGDGDPGDSAAYPESFVLSMAAGEGGTPRSGRLELAAEGTLALTEEVATPAADWRLRLRATSLLKVEELPATGEVDLLYRLEDGSVWYDALGDGNWVQLQSPELWVEEDGVIRPIAEDGRVNISSNLSPGFNRAALECSYGGTALNNSAGKFESTAISGSVFGIFASCLSSAGVAVRAFSAGNGDAIYASTVGTGYGVFVDKARVELYQDFDEQVDIPAAPETGRIRLYVDGGRLNLLPAAGAGSSVQAGICAAQAGASAVTNTASETPFSLDFTLPADSLTSGCRLRLSARGVYSCANGSSSETLRLRLYAGTALLADSGAQTPAPGASPSAQGWSLLCEGVCIDAGVSGSLELQGEARISASGATAALWDLENSSTITLDTSSAQTLTLTAQWNNALSTSTITLRQLIVEVLQ